MENMGVKKFIIIPILLIIAIIYGGVKVNSFNQMVSNEVVSTSKAFLKDQLVKNKNINNNDYINLELRIKELVGSKYNVDAKGTTGAGDIKSIIRVYIPNNEDYDKTVTLDLQ